MWDSDVEIASDFAVEIAEDTSVTRAISELICVSGTLPAESNSATPLLAPFSANPIKSSPETTALTAVAIASFLSDTSCAMALESSVRVA